LRCEFPFDPHGGRVAWRLLRIDFGDEDIAFVEIAIKTLTAQDTYLDFYYASQVPCFGV
jgi:hypothetical protein